MIRVLLLCHEALVPPPVKALSLDQIDTADWRTEYYVLMALERIGYVVRVCGVDRSLEPLKNDIQDFSPDVVFNLLEEFAGEGLLEHFGVSFLEAKGIPTTGAGAYELILAKNKVAAKSVLKSSGVNVPGNSRYPKIVKLIDEESSRGISDKSIVRNQGEERKQRKFLTANYSSGVCSEEYIDGRELHVAVAFRSGQPVVSPVWETDFGEAPGAKVISERHKWDFAYRDEVGIKLQPAQALDARVARKVQAQAVRSVRALGIRSYARVDIRLRQNGEPVVLEVNPNPDLAWGDEFAQCMRSTGLEYDELIELIVKQALRCDRH